MSINKKLESLKHFIHEKGKDGVVIAFSGGLDSSVLAYICHSILDEKSVAVTSDSPIFSSEEIKEAKRLASKIGIKHIIIHTREFLKEEFVRNYEDRCYFCKGLLLDELIKLAEELGFKYVFEGTNLSDLKGHRPGFKAVKERKPKVISPWVELGFSKDEIRRIALNLGLSIWNKPPLACLASRIPYGERITVERLKRIEKAERIVRRLSGVQQVRVRDHNGLARIEVGKDEINLLLKENLIEKIVLDLKKLGFKYITVDLEGYSAGSMLRMLKNRDS